MDDSNDFELAVPMRLSCGAEIEVPLAFCDDLFYLDLLDQLVRTLQSSQDDDVTRKCAGLVRRLSDYVDPGAAIERARNSTKKPRRRMRRSRR